MEHFAEQVARVNGVINDFVWVRIGLIILLGAGLIMTCCTKFFQVRHIGHWWGFTIGSIFKRDSSAKKKGDSTVISQFQALCTALAATIGTGNIAGISAAIVLGGAGAVFWMWIAAFLGMMTKFSEIVLGIYFRRRNEDGEWSGGPMYYLRDGVGAKPGLKQVGAILALLFAVFAMIASFGIGNMSQINKIVLNVQSAFFYALPDFQVGGISVIALSLGAALMAVSALIILKGLQGIASAAEKIVPAMAVLYLLGGFIIIGCNITKVGAIFASIFRSAFSWSAVGGAAGGLMLKEAITQGCKRGIFSNEAGLGSSVMVHSSANVREPVRQGMWGIFEVFFDTIIVCTMTAIIVLSTGAVDLATGLALPGVNDATLVAQAFGGVFGKPGEMFVAIAILLFAFTTVLGWSQYGAKATEYLFGTKGAKVFRVIFVLVILLGAVMESSLAWDISDTFNALMMIPNLIGVLILSPLVVRIVNNYIARRFRNEDIAPMLSNDPAIQAEMAAKEVKRNH